MGDITPLEKELFPKALEKLGDLQELFSDKLVEKGSLAAFIPYFLTGGHDAADALRRLSDEGAIRPLMRWNPDKRDIEYPRAQALGDLLSASQMGIYGSVAKGALSAGKRGLMSLYDKILKEPFDAGRREALKKGSAVAADSVIPTPVKAAAAAAGVGALAKAVPEVAGKFKFNSLAEYLTAMRRIADDDALHFFQSEGVPPIPTKMSQHADQVLEEILHNNEVVYTRAKDHFKRLKQMSKKEQESYTQSLENDMRTNFFERENWGDEVHLTKEQLQRNKEIDDYFAARYAESNTGATDFSPRAKEEMRALKALHGAEWTNYINGRYVR